MQKNKNTQQALSKHQNPNHKTNPQAKCANPKAQQTPKLKKVENT